MSTTDRDEVLKQVLAIVDMFEDENRLMSIDIAVKEIEEGGGIVPNEPGIDRLMQTAMEYAARQIGDAIRARFNLPAKEG
jgi:hypothetical protein